MSHDEMHVEEGIARLVRMANQIGTFFESKPHEEGVHGVADHINKFWEPRMRRALYAHLDGAAQGEGLAPLVREAVLTRRGRIDPALRAEPA